MKEGPDMAPCVFLDRDGVLTELVFNSSTGIHESAKAKEDLVLCNGVGRELLRLRQCGFLLVVISNQPDIAKGKVASGDLAQVERAFVDEMNGAGVPADGVYYCYHHPAGILPELTGKCDCRKPATGLVDSAVADLDIDIDKSWFVGDRDSDIECGRSAGCRTILVRSIEARKAGWGSCSPDHVAEGLEEAVEIILREQ